ncbi:hypothetical protein ABZ837_39145 [Streptomyces sp. NPDC047197]|uniref:hypothetical protein n=1 Tax=Streptomyces sp. NPDC047197 TaxID=3155477 RepID=UPI0033EC70FC
MRADVGEDAGQERLLGDRAPGVFVGGHRDDEGAGEFQGGGGERLGAGARAEPVGAVMQLAQVMQQQRRDVAVVQERYRGLHLMFGQAETLGVHHEREGQAGPGPRVLVARRLVGQGQAVGPHVLLMAVPGERPRPPALGDDRDGVHRVASRVPRGAPDAHAGAVRGEQGQRTEVPDLQLLADAGIGMLLLHRAGAALPDGHGLEGLDPVGRG